MPNRAHARAGRPTLEFLGGAGTVTGSKHLLTVDGRTVLLDCGLFQGLKALRQRNWTALPLDAATLDAVVLSHAHIDHSGAIPLLVRQGFRGPVHCTAATADLLEVLLLDAAHLQEEEAAYANRHRTSKHSPALPLYTTADAREALRLLETHRYAEEFGAAPGIRAVLHRAGHILGSATVTATCGTRGPCRIVFSGDLGRFDRPILHDPEPVARADVLLVESTYGDRLHPSDATEQLARVVRETADSAGVLLVPAFAVDRTQELLYVLRELEDAGRIPALPIFIDSPMATRVTEIYAHHADEHDPDMRRVPGGGASALAPRHSRMVRSVEESKALNEQRGPMVLISASGMATGGRVLHHLLRRLPEESTTVLLPGYQAAGTRGRALAEGARSVRIFGQDVRVRARVARIDGFSAHADQAELMRWLGGFAAPPRETWVVHGEPQAADMLAARIRQKLGWQAQVAQDGAAVPLG